MRFWPKGTSLVQPNLRCPSLVDVLGRFARPLPLSAEARCGNTGFLSRIPVESLIPFIAFNDLPTGHYPAAAAFA
jgi:hypothetical protein